MPSASDIKETAERIIALVHGTWASNKHLQARVEGELRVLLEQAYGECEAEKAGIDRGDFIP